MSPSKVRRPRGRSLIVSSLAVSMITTVASTVIGAPTRRVIDAIAARVDDTCITERELVRFTSVRRAQLERELAKKPADRAAALAALRKEGLETLLERRLFENEAQRQAIQVEPAEIDRALAAVAQQNAITVPQLLVAAKEQGFDEATYRAELRAQLIEAKLVQLDAPRRFRDWNDLTNEARLERLGRAREALLGELGERSFVEVHEARP